MKKLIVLCTLLLTVFLSTVPVGCQQKTDVIENIHIFHAQSPDYPPPPGGWISQSTGSHPTMIQRLFDPGDKIFLGLVIREDVEDKVTFSRVTFFNRETSIEEEIVVSSDDLGPFEPGWKGLLV